ncbi:hypothetical protein [Roseburia inulinivorans]
MIFQLDRYHICQEILRKIGDKEAQKEIRELFDADKPDEMLEYIKTYAASVESPDKKITGVKKRWNYINILIITGRDFCHTTNVGLR